MASLQQPAPAASGIHGGGNLQSTLDRARAPLNGLRNHIKAQ